MTAAGGDAVATARAAIRAGDLLNAYDIIMAAIAAADDAADLRYLLVLTLARMGETERAASLFAAYDLAAAANEDSLALGARLLKDRAIAATGADRPALFAAAAQAYLGAYTRFGGYFSLINAASLSALAGATAATAHARRALADAEVARPTSYFAAATAAEAHLLLGDRTAALAAAQAALACADADLGARGSTVRQFRLLGAHGVAADLAAALCDALRPPPVLFYAGHMFQADAACEADIAAQIDARLAAAGTSIAYGALACGADILCRGHFAPRRRSSRRVALCHRRFHRRIGAARRGGVAAAFSHGARRRQQRHLRQRGGLCRRP
ncbi:MAG: tetratricopeptide repeat-containing protein [Polymorphobacter sp.]